jgi:hypothetical protein
MKLPHAYEGELPTGRSSAMGVLVLFHHNMPVGASAGDG